MDTAFIQKYDFSKVEGALLKRGKKAEEARNATAHLQAFMALCAMYPGKTLAAWHLMDDAWHEFIVRTVEYEAFCNAAFGSFLHHDADAFGTPEFTTAWTETVDLAKVHFGLDLVQDEHAPPRGYDRSILHDHASGGLSSGSDGKGGGLLLLPHARSPPISTPTDATQTQEMCQERQVWRRIPQTLPKPNSTGSTRLPSLGRKWRQNR